MVLPEIIYLWWLCRSNRRKLPSILYSNTIFSTLSGYSGELGVKHNYLAASPDALPEEKKKLGTRLPYMKSPIIRSLEGENGLARLEAFCDRRIQLPNVVYSR